MSRDTTGRLSSGRGRRNFLAAIGVGATASLSGCVGVFAQGAREVTIAGSSTVFPITEAVAAEFDQERDDVTVSISQTGTGGGFSNFFCPGMTDVNNASRTIVDVEEQQCAENGIEPIEFTVATDALTVVVNPDADWVDCLTVEDLADIWRGDAERWSDVDDDWPDEEFELFGADTTSGTYDYFTENVIHEVHGADATHRTDYHATEQDRSIVQGVRGNEHAMGYFGFSYYNENPDSIKALGIDDGGDDGCVPPTIETAREGDYTPLSRDLYIYVSGRSLTEPEVVDFLEFYFEHAATDLVEEVGYVPITDQRRDENLRNLEAEVERVTGE